MTVFPGYLDVVERELGEIAPETRWELYRRWLERGVKEHVVLWLVERNQLFSANALRALPSLAAESTQAYRTALGEILRAVRPEVRADASDEVRDRLSQGHKRGADTGRNSVDGLVSAIVEIGRFATQNDEDIGLLAFTQS